MLNAVAAAADDVDDDEVWSQNITVIINTFGIWASLKQFTMDTRLFFMFLAHGMNMVVQRVS